MRILPLSCVLAGLLLPIGAAAQVTVSNTTYTTTQTVFSPTTLTTSGTVQVNSGANISFLAGTSITLAPGFKVVAGGVFRAFTSLDADDDGIPNDWEVAHGLDPTVSDSGNDADGDGLSNLLEYELGTDPTGASSNTSDPGQATTQLKVHRPN